LNALQTLLSHFVFNENGEWAHVVLDINGYRDSRREKIEEMVRNFIDRVRFHNSEVELPAMNAFERRQVHTFVSEYPDIVSESTGEGRNRRVVLKLKQ
jgi:spoIIIJ-associated protein